MALSDLQSATSSLPTVIVLTSKPILLVSIALPPFANRLSLVQQSKHAQGSVIPANTLKLSINTQHVITQQPTIHRPSTTMRSAFVAAAFAAGALAVPLLERDIVYEADVVYATKYVTVTAGDVAPTDAPAPYSLTKSHYGHRKPKPKSSSVEQPQGYGGWTSSWASTWTVSVPASTAAQQQAPPSSSPEEQAPAYTSVEAPAPSSYEAPQSSYQPAPTSSESAPSSAAGSSDSDPKPTDYQSTVLWHHNVHRYNHSAPALAWNESLVEIAQKIADSCNYAHQMYVPAEVLPLKNRL